MGTIVRTASIKLTVGHEAFGETIVAFAGALNHVGAFAQGQGLWSAPALQRALYREVRDRFGLKAQMTCSVFRQVAAAYKHAEPDKQARKRARGVTFRPTAMALQHERDWRLCSDGRLSINTLKGRVMVAFRCGEHQRQYLDGSWTFGAAMLVFRRGRYFLNISVSKALEAAPETGQVVGVDLGQTYLAVASGCKGGAVFFGGGHIKNKHRHFRRLRKKLQAKGTRGAKRLLRRISGKQRRFQADVNHRVSKAVVAFAARCGPSLLAVEDLGGIRERSRHRKKQRGEFHGWGFQQLRLFLTYKAESKGMSVVAVDPRNTSKGCSRCGHVADGQRERHNFRCLACGLQLHSDLNASRNIALRASLTRQDLVGPGTPSACPKGSSDEAEARQGLEAEGRSKPFR